ncbi:unnamed protein product [Enterobius vermicularis]|uniref:CAP_N domain-containing protein n=1 Tax=Enterobius vermicularis TaxID=51028 RepID=A0A0N4V6P6_ENTVE|nr:unnamed protein product [Enterobius vermicularis]
MAGNAQFEKLIQRLEVATTRLEALSSQKPALAPKPGSTVTAAVSAPG